MARGHVLSLGLTLAFCVVSAVASAHAPLPRQVAVSPDGASIAIDLPGFGLLVRPGPERPFMYVCDALLDVTPRADPRWLGFSADGSLLVGTQDGVRILTADGCPRDVEGSELDHAEVIGLALEPVIGGGGAQTAYAVVRGEQAGLWRSSDGGRRWTLQAPFAGAEAAAVVLRADAPEQVYVSITGAAGTTVYASHDGGAALDVRAQDVGLTLLHAESKASGRLWARARDAESIGNRGVAILRADGPGGPWQPVLRVNYFGGFVVDPDGAIWVGDELGGLYRSTDGGETFRNLESAADVACLAYGGASLWACNPGTPQEPALQTLLGGEPPFAGVVGLAEVDRLSECPGVDVSRVCASAWLEWQRDVILQPPANPADAAVGGEDSEGSRDAGAAEPTPPGRAPARAAGCTLQPLALEGSNEPPVAWGLLLAFVAARAHANTAFLRSTRRSRWMGRR